MFTIQTLHTQKCFHFTCTYPNKVLSGTKFLLGNMYQGSLQKIWSMSYNAFFLSFQNYLSLLALACSLLTEVLSIAKNNVCFLNYFLAFFHRNMEGDGRYI